MKRAFRIAVLSIFTLALSIVAIPAQAAEHGFYREQDYRHAHYVANDRYNDRRHDSRYSDNRGGYYDRDNHAGRSAAIIGAIIGGIGGFIADQSVRNHDRR